MIRVQFRMFLHALRTQILVALNISTEVSDGLLFVKVTGHVVFKIGFHVVNVKGLVHCHGGCV